MLTIVDYGVTNVRRVAQAFHRLGVALRVAAEPDAVRQARAIVLPGAGTFDEDIARLRALGLEAPLYDAAQNGVPLLGIGLGMQLLFEVREAMDEQRGLGILQGRVQRFPPGLPALHMGWNQIQQVRPSPLWRDVANQRYAYFVHTDHVEPRDPDIVVGTTDYGGEFASVVAQGNVFGLQCHPEKSQDVGRALLRNFALAAGLTEGGA